MANVAPSQIIVISATGERADTITDAVHLNTSPVFAPDGRSLYFVSNRDGSRDIFQQEFRGRRPGGRAVRLTTGASATSISISALGDYLVYGAEIMRSNLWSSPIDAQSSGSAAPMRQVTLGDQEVECVNVSRDGQWLLYDSNKSGNQDIYKMPIGGGDPIQLTTDPADDFCGMMSADGREIAFYSFRLGGTRRVFTMLANGQRQEVALENDVGDQEWAPDWSPDGRGIAFTAARAGGARFISTIARAAGNRWGNRRDYTNVLAGNVQWSHDGRYLATVSDSGVIVMSPNGEGVRVVVPQSVIGDAKPAYVTWGPDSRLLYYRTFERSGASSFWAVPVNGGRPRLLLALNDPLRAARRVEFATDGKRLFFTLSGDAASVWRLELRP
jgi:Tol biopolymer transport system component